MTTENTEIDYLVRYNAQRKINELKLKGEWKEGDLLHVRSYGKEYKIGDDPDMERHIKRIEWHDKRMLERKRLAYENAQEDEYVWL